MFDARAMRAFRTDQRGATAMLFTVCSVLLFWSVALAVDGARWFSARSYHANSVDAALLAGARYMQLNPGDSTGAIATAQRFYDSNLASSSLGISGDLQFEAGDGGQSLSFTGTATVPTTFLNLFGFSSLEVTQPAKAALAQSGLNSGSDVEIALMLDVTGSMCDDGTGPCTSGTKISGVKKAASDLSTIVLGQNGSTARMRVALVPFSSAVRIDADGSTNPLMQALTGQPARWSGWYAGGGCTGGGGYMNGEVWVSTGTWTCTWTPTYVTNWKLIPCVTERTFESSIGFDPSDSVPGPSNWLLGHGGDRFPLSWDSSSTPMSSYNGTSEAQMTWQWDYTPDGSGCMIQPGNEIMPLTTDLTSVTARINALTAYGPTAGALGTVWAQYMLSPKWSPIWTGYSTPGSYADTQAKLANGAPVLRKVAVLMTDGGFNTFRQGVTDYPADSGTQMKTVSNFAVSVCNNMKANGIEIYTVGFNLNALSAGEQAIATKTLQDCGSDISHFYNSVNVDQLDAAFKDIALRVSPVRLVQ